MQQQRKSIEKSDKDTDTAYPHLSRFVFGSNAPATYLVFKARYAFAKLYNIYVKRVQDTIFAQNLFTLPFSFRRRAATHHQA